MKVAFMDGNLVSADSASAFPLVQLQMFVWNLLDLLLQNKHCLASILQVQERAM